LSPRFAELTPGDQTPSGDFFLVPNSKAIGKRIETPGNHVDDANKVLREQELKAKEAELEARAKTLKLAQFMEIRKE